MEETKDVRTAAIVGACRGKGSKTAKQGKVVTAAEAVIASLEAEGVTTVFGYPGAQAIRVYDALYDSDQIVHILARHEQAAVHMADGFARSTGRPGVVLVTSGPGATNTITGIATAYMDSVPLIVVTCNVPLGMIGTDGFQEADIVGATMPIVKHSFLLRRSVDIAKTLRKAFHIAVTGRPGPVLIDIPSDLLGEELVFEYPDQVNLPSYKPTYKGNARQVRMAAKLIEQAERPVLYVGGGAVASGAQSELRMLAELMQIPVVHTLMGKGAFPSSHPLNFGLIGMHGSRYANLALRKSDLIVACGARFDDRATGAIEHFAPEAQIVHIDIDPAEIDKNRKADVPIVGDLRMVLTSLLEVLEKDKAKSVAVAPSDAEIVTDADVPSTEGASGASASSTGNAASNACANASTQAWLAQVNDWRECFPLWSPDQPERDSIVPARVVRELSRQLDPQKSIVTTDVGQHQMWAAQFVERALPRTFLSSGGLGTMGFGLPAAIGAAVAHPDKQVVCITGDGSFQMNSQEMATAATNKVPIKVVILNNRCLGMVHQWQELFYGGRFSQTLLSGNPDFVKLAAAYDWGAERVTEGDDVRDAIERLLESEGPCLLEVVISEEDDVMPMMLDSATLDEEV